MPFDTEIPPSSLSGIGAGVQACRRCDLWRDATRGVPGEGPGDADLMLVGEQPGVAEDLAGKPFVGPAGRMLDRALLDAGVPRAGIFVTNAVKHFKHEQRGKRRLHKTPDSSEIAACRWWLDAERATVRPRIIVAMGGSAAHAVFGRPLPVMKSRRRELPLADGACGVITIHPSFLLRMRDHTAKAEAYVSFVLDLRFAWELLGESEVRRVRSGARTSI